MRFDFEYIDHDDVERKRRHNMELSVANEPWRIPLWGTVGGWRYVTRDQYVDYKLTGRVPD